MASIEVVKKLHYIGVWLEDEFTDKVVQNIAAHTKAAKGKKVKVIMNSAGLRFKKAKWFQEKVTEYYPLISVKTVTRNPVFSLCVMFILTDAVKKYRIVALKCASDAEAIHLAAMFTQLRKDVTPINTELKKRPNGNWTLRDRSTHNANRHLAEVFNEKQEKELKQNPPVVPNGTAVSHVPMPEKVMTEIPQERQKPTYNKRTENNPPKAYKSSVNGIVIRDDDEYVIETEVSPYPASKSNFHTRGVDPAAPNGTQDQEVTAFKEDIDTLNKEMRDIKTMLSTMQNRDAPDAYATQPSPKVQKKPTSPRSTQYATLPATNHSEPVVRRSEPRTYEATLVSARRYTPGHDPWAAHRRHSGTFVLPAQLDRQLTPGNNSLRGSPRVQFETESVRSVGSTRSHQSKSRKFSVRRPIEQVYSRPSMKQHNSVRRPVTVYVVGKNELAVYEPNRYRDVAL